MTSTLTNADLPIYIAHIATMEKYELVAYHLRMKALTFREPSNMDHPWRDRLIMLEMRTRFPSLTWMER